MITGNQISYLSQKEINKEKWDACVSESPNSRIYAFSFYLDFMSKQWDALVLNDYDAVMPITWNKKFGIHYLYQPAFCASLGIFGTDLSENMIREFLNAIPKKFRLIEISLNAGNNFPSAIAGYYPRLNYFLDLNKDYQALFNNYRESHKRNINKALQLECELEKGIPVDEVIRLTKDQLRNKDGTRPEDYTHFKSLFEYLNERGLAETYAIVDQKEKILASAAFFYSHHRAYYILVGNHPDGKTIGASHALIDAFIKDNAGKNMTLDFEGSDIRNLAFFYSSFGAEEEHYPGIKINKLPCYIRILKNQ